MKIELRDKILTTSSLQDEVWGDVFALYVLCSFSGLRDAARGLLEAYFDAQPDFEPHPMSPAKQILGLIWKHAELTRPRNIPWGVAGFDGTQHPPEYEIGNPAFFQLDKWTETSWIPRTDYGDRDSRQSIDDNYDQHQWKTSEDPWAHAICARLLCRVPEGQVADRAAISEAFEAVDRLFIQVARRGGLPHCHIFPMKVYFSLAVGLGKHEKAREIFKLACTPEEWCPQDLLPIPALYEAYFGDDAASNPDTEQLIAESDAAPAVNSLTEALVQRKQNGQQEPLHGVAWPELLERFSEAAFKVHRDDYAQINNPPQRPSDILLPPITPEKLADVEQTLGPLPADLREMVQIANGFRGAWHFLGGGFAGVDRLTAVPSGNYEIIVGIKSGCKVSTRTETEPDGTTRTVTVHTYEVGMGSTEGMKAGPVWIGCGTEENDDFEHMVCPPETWRKLAEGGAITQGGRDVEGCDDGEYRVIQTAHWMDYTHHDYRSMRHWVASETARMERELELGGEEGEGEGED